MGNIYIHVSYFLKYCHVQSIWVVKVTTSRAYEAWLSYAALSDAAATMNPQVQFHAIYRKTSSINRTKSQNLNVSCLLLQWSLPNPLKPGVKLRMKM